eukprot:CAMPEP_0170584868 /NCGR_PEP_ID=MMETSP0224-20130122/8905_1 /TAXON_ID=285029 /ORGANISM="Togula jolla, Strain CCCM 725" /LENGTH=863 /DNA_ID=CAMNT_0010908305 /DNA_START=1 /DNA_END=2592 /DNA_ORIENTATION=+
MRRHFWVSEERCELCWGKSRSEQPQTMELKDCVGIIYGPMTSTFQRCTSLEDPPWSCFSLLFSDRTLDLAVPGDELVDQWFLGLQYILLGSPSCVTAHSEAQLVFRKVYFKLRYFAHKQGFTLRRLLINRLRSLGKDKSFMEALAKQQLNGKTSGPGPSSGTSAVSTEATLDADAIAKAERKKKKREMKEASESRHSASPSPSPDEAGGETSRRRAKDRSKDKGERRAIEEAYSRAAADTEKQLEALSARLEALRPSWEAKFGSALPLSELGEVMRSCDAISWQGEKCAELDREVESLRSSNEGSKRQLEAAEKVEKQLKKVAKQLKESETAVETMSKELEAARAGANNSEQASYVDHAEKERVEAQTSHLEKRVKELEQQVEQTEKGQDLAENYKAKIEEQEKELARLEKVKLETKDKLEGLTRERQAIEKKHEENMQKLAATENFSRGLVTLLQKLQGTVQSLQSDQRKVKGECEIQLRSIADSFPPLKGAFQKIGASNMNLMERYREMAEEKKKLHNLVLELKGNIRVFVRVRPMAEKEKATEPTGEATISFAEDCKLSVYAEEQGRRKWFDFDRVFPPKTAQQEVFEEVRPLATSVLDGFNVCIFAYGQTGSGKTFTMSGTDENPGLNKRVLSELFRIREERKVEMNIKMYLMVSEIYNEAIKDLLSSKPKKLDVKTNPDGSNCVPGLTEIEVESVEHLLKCMAEAQENRTTMATDMNEESSRSHSIVQLRTHNVLKDKREYVGKINLIDLAGSENVSKSGVSGQGMREAQNINKSLSALGDVIQSLVAKTPHVPYRNSKLTMMLKDSLGGDSKTLMIVQTSPAQVNVTETLSSLNFASRARNVELGKAKRNVKTAGDA